ncbi:MAG: DUF6790 family protein [Halobacteriota archaeon]|jgi:hypothetical protein
MPNRAAEYWPYVLFTTAIVAAVLNIALFGGGIVEPFLLWFLVIIVGIGSLWAFTGHAFVADDVARSIGWPTGGPFQFEVALHNLAVGVLGVPCFWVHGGFWSATVIAFAVFGIGAAYGHIRDMRSVTTTRLVMQGRFCISAIPLAIAAHRSPDCVPHLVKISYSSRFSAIE